MDDKPVGVKREVEGMIKTEKQEFYEFGDDDEIIKDENDKRIGDERQSNEREKKYACDSCGKRFQWPSKLKRHERSHTSSKEFECRKCKKRFTVKSSLKLHLRI